MGSARYSSTVMSGGNPKGASVTRFGESVWMFRLCDLVTFGKWVTRHCSCQASGLLSSSAVSSLVLERNEELMLPWGILSLCSFLGCASVLPKGASSDTCLSNFPCGGTSCAADIEPLARPGPSFSFLAVSPVSSRRELLVEEVGGEGRELGPECCQKLVV